MTKKMSPNQLANLKRFTTEQDREQARINGRKGALALAQKKKELKTFKSIAEYVLALTPQQNKLDVISKAFPEVPQNAITHRVFCLLQLLNRAEVHGDVQAFDRLLNLLGEKQPDTVMALQAPVLNILPVASNKDKKDGK